MTQAAFFDASAGIAGDMCLGALVDAGWPPSRLDEVVRALGLDRIRIRVAKVTRGPLAATKVDVLYGDRPADEVREGGRHGRGLAPIVARLRAATTLPEAARERAVRAFEALARAESAVHGVLPDRVHFHEVGEADALVDVLGTCTALADLGVDDVHVGPLPLGEGVVETAHGALALPAPAVAHLLVGHPVFASGERHEQVTPTGAALVRTLARGHRLPGGFSIRTVGAGAGTFEGGRLPNVLRVFLGSVEEEEGAATDAVLLETNLDDATGQEIARAIDAALEAGALDAWSVPATMKKGRPGAVLSVLVERGLQARLETVLFRETPTLGVRRVAVGRTVLARRHVRVETPWGAVRVKVRDGPDGASGTPEHDDALARAREYGVALRRVLEAARAAYERGATT